MYMENSKINWEERRFWAATMILSGMCGQYHHTIPNNYQVESSVELADRLIKKLSSGESKICPDLLSK